MNDDELRRSLRALEIPPPDPIAAGKALQRAREAMGEHEEPVARSTRSRPSAPSWTWRDWLWPSPIVWGAFAAVWLLVAARFLSAERSARGQPSYAAQSPLPSPAEPRVRFFVLNDYRDLLPELRPLVHNP